jgi:hypothetical protein
MGSDSHSDESLLRIAAGCFKSQLPVSARMVQLVDQELRRQLDRVGRKAGQGGLEPPTSGFGNKAQAAR